MRIDYLVVGVVLILSGGLQIWLRRQSPAPSNSLLRGWTRILGYVSIVVGVLVVTRAISGG